MTRHQSMLSGLLLSTLGLSAVASHAESFDKPLHKRVLDLGRSTYLMQKDDRHVTITCWYYAHFMIKQRDDPGLKGAEWIALVPSQPENLPRCTQSQHANQRNFEEWSSEFKHLYGWDGYFAGVKHNLIFLNRSDSDVNGGIPFTVFEPDTKTKVFEDSSTITNPGDSHLSFISAPGDQIIIHYLRVASASCSIPKSGEACWSKLKQQTGLTAPIPKCTDYEGKYAGTAPSVIAYPVEVSLFPKPVTKPLGNPIRCYPTE